MSDGAPLGGLRIHRTEDGETLVLALEGELDLASAAALETELSDPLFDGFQRVVVDLSQLGFMDSRGLVTLAHAQKTAHEEQKTFVLRRAGRQIQRLLELTGLGSRFTFQD